MRKETINIYKFSELSDEAKQYAINEYYAEGDYHWMAENRDTLDKFIKLFNLKHMRGDYLELQCSEDIKNLTGIRLMAYLFNNYYTDIYKRKYYSKWVKDAQGNNVLIHRYSRCDRESYTCALTGYCMDNDILAPIYRAMEKPYDYTFADLISDCYDEFKKAVDADIEHQQSIEYFTEHAEANGYEYLENGSRA